MRNSGKIGMSGTNAHATLRRPPRKINQDCHAPVPTATMHTRVAREVSQVRSGPPEEPTGGGAVKAVNTSLCTRMPAIHSRNKGRPSRGGHRDASSLAITGDQWVFTDANSFSPGKAFGVP